MVMVVVGTALANPAPVEEKQLLQLLKKLLVEERQDSACIATHLFDFLDISAKPELQCPTIDPNTDNLASVSKRTRLGLEKVIKEGLAPVTQAELTPLLDNVKTEDYITQIVEDINSDFASDQGTTLDDALDVMEHFYKTRLMKMYDEAFVQFKAQLRGLGRGAVAGMEGTDEPGCLDQGYDATMLEACVVKTNKLLNKAFDMWDARFPSPLIGCNEIGIADTTDMTYESLKTKVSDYNSCILTAIVTINDKRDTLMEEVSGSPLAELLVATKEEQRMTSLPLTLASEWGKLFHATGRNPWSKRTLEDFLF